MATGYTTGATIAGASSPSRPGEQAHSSLANAVDELEQALQHLMGAANNVVAPGGPQVVRESATANRTRSLSSVGESLSSLAERIGNVSSSIHDISNRIDI